MCVCGFLRIESVIAMGLEVRQGSGGACFVRLFLRVEVLIAPAFFLLFFVSWGVDCGHGSA